MSLVSFERGDSELSDDVKIKIVEVAPWEMIAFEKLLPYFKIFAPYSLQYYMEN